MRLVLWEVDAQTDFMLSGGKLYVPGAEKIIPNLNRLVEQARQDRVLLVSSADAHQPDDPEFREWPTHCVKGTPGAELILEARAARRLVIPNQENFVFPDDLRSYQQIHLEKNTLDVFDNPNTGTLLSRLAGSQNSRGNSNADFLVFGVVTEHCVHWAADGLLRRGYGVSIVEDAIQSLDEKRGREILGELRSKGARVITTEQALTLIGRDAEDGSPSQNGKTAGN
ncbi:MAG TPA: isochorismatase family cysteine hydrolase [Candidatus Sulfotelmatobacter sp.]|nr:isochorismatase family cysteine hydrolase [Candidatus Sulfotelmatobacter sp.]